MEQPKITFVELPATSFGKLNAPLVKDVYTIVPIFERAVSSLEAVLLQQGYEDVECINPRLNWGGKFTRANFRRSGESDYLLLSSITRTIPQTRELAEDCKKANPACNIIAGGVHVTFAPEEALKWADVVVRYEGEKTLVEVLEKLEKKESLENVKGISYKLDNKIIHNESREALTEEELSNLPIPDYSKYSKRAMGVANTSRGCPYACNFCCVTQFHGNKYRRKTNERILEELSLIKKRSHSIFFSDDNFAAKKSETKELLKEMIKNGDNKTSYHCQLSINSAFSSLKRNEIDEDFLELLRKAGFFGVYLGVESLNEQTLNLYNKPVTAERNKIAVKAFGDAGLWRHVMMMIGGDGDTPESLDYELEWAKQNTDSVQFSVPVNFPKTDFTEEMEKQGRILIRDYYLYDGIHVIVEPKHFSPYGLQQKSFDMHKEFYAPRQKGTKKSLHPWHKRITHAYARKIIWDIEHEPQTIKHIENLRDLKKKF